MRGGYLEETTEAEVSEATHSKQDQMLHQSSEALAVQSLFKQGLPQAPSIEIGYMVRDAAGESGAGDSMQLIWHNIESHLHFLIFKRQHVTLASFQSKVSLFAIWKYRLAIKCDLEIYWNLV
jgi:hypothetical protein